MHTIRWSHDFVCAVKGSEVTCNTGTDYHHADQALSFKGEKLIASNVHRQTVSPSERWSSDNVKYYPLKLRSSVGNIIGCFLNEQTGIIRCIEGKNTDDGRKRIAGEIEMWMTIH